MVHPSLPILLWPKSFIVEMPANGHLLIPNPPFPHLLVNQSFPSPILSILGNNTNLTPLLIYPPFPMLLLQPPHMLPHHYLYHLPPPPLSLHLSSLPPTNSSSHLLLHNLHLPPLITPLTCTILTLLMAWSLPGCQLMISLEAPPSGCPSLATLHHYGSTTISSPTHPIKHFFNPSCPPTHPPSLLFNLHLLPSTLLFQTYQSVKCTLFMPPTSP